MSGVGGPAGSARITQVTGGSEGLAATYARVLALAATYDAAGSRLRGLAGEGARTLRNGDLVESALLSPFTFAEAESAVLAACSGPEGLVGDSVGWESDAVVIRATVTALEDTDDLVHASLEALDYLVGRTLGLGLGVAAPVLAPALVGGIVVGSQVLPLLPPGMQEQVNDGEAACLAALESALTGHPELVRHAVNGGGGLLDGLWDGLTPLLPGGPFGLPSFTPDTESAAGLLATLYGPETGHHERVVALDVPGSDTAPGSVQDVVDHLAGVAGLSQGASSPANGTIQIQTLSGQDGTVRHIVYVPGTDDLATLPWTQDGDVRDMATNVLLVDGQDTAYQDGILQAMRDAGIGPDDPVLLAGHSQGGMEAVSIASRHRGFHITDVITAGAPTAQIEGFPDGVHVLSLEHRGDVVPLFDGEDNPDSAQQVTVRFTDGPDQGVFGNHGFDHYSHGAAAVDLSDDPSIRNAVAGLRDHGFLSGSTGPHGAGPVVTSQVIQITRAP